MKRRGLAASLFAYQKVSSFQKKSAFVRSFVCPITRSSFLMSSFAFLDFGPFLTGSSGILLFYVEPAFTVMTNLVAVFWVIGSVFYHLLKAKSLEKLATLTDHLKRWGGKFFFQLFPLASFDVDQFLHLTEKSSKVGKCSSWGAIKRAEFRRPLASPIADDAVFQNFFNAAQASTSPSISTNEQKSQKRGRFSSHFRAAKLDIWMLQWQHLINRPSAKTAKMHDCQYKAAL